MESKNKVSEIPSLTAEHLMKKIDRVISEDMTVPEVTKILRAERVGGLPVVDKSGTFCGVVTVYNIFDAMNIARQMFFGKRLWYSIFKQSHKAILVKDIYIRERLSVRPQTPMEDVIEMMLKENLHSLPVTDDQQKVFYGVIGRHDITWAVFGDNSGTP